MTREMQKQIDKQRSESRQEKQSAYQYFVRQSEDAQRTANANYGFKFRSKDVR
jgi:hypothetical protein